MTLLVTSDNEYHEIGAEFVANIKTVAFALSHINRFNGHYGAYSVAQHSVHVAEHLPPELQLAGLLHDAHEAYIGDIVSPLKNLIPAYRELESTYQDAIDRQFGVLTRGEAVVAADLRMLVTEADAFGANIHDGHWPGVPAYPKQVLRWPAHIAEARFLEMFEELTR